MSDYTPTTERVRQIYGWAECDSAARSGRHQRFDRWLDQVKAEAWGEGYGKGFYAPSPTPTHNPYRDEATNDH